MKDERISELYGVNADKEEIKNRYRKLQDKFNERFGRNGEFFSSPGRIEVCGNHTDHNNGKVVVAAINCDTLACVDKAKGGKITIESEGYPSICLNISYCDGKPCPFEVENSEKGTSIALVKGVVTAYIDKGFSVGGFDAVMDSTVFQSAGVSSSASYELLISVILNEYYNEGNIQPFDMAKASQYAENRFFCKPCGLLDQLGIAFGGLMAIDFHSDPPVVKPLPKFPDDMAIVIVNTAGDHADLTTHFAAIKTDMVRVADTYGVTTLGKLSYSKFCAGLADRYHALAGIEIMRAFHFFQENNRVEELVEGLNSHNFDRVKAAVTESGNSSWMLLQNCYVSGDRLQPIATALTYLRSIESTAAVRIHGGGFAGTILCILDRDKLGVFLIQAERVFGKKNVFSCSIRQDGACRVKY
ncbi:MAG: galactokinase family protein [Clostridia bacterium]|nr:galactokinase family protein [Clostridia bacterium]